jgi:NAD(P)-dependent dehydrogenase (short-subunit alcohol dehydrogenase family)
VPERLIWLDVAAQAAELAMARRRFEQQVAWITGAGSGIGRSCARQFADEGATVALSGRRLERLEATVRDIESRGGKAIAVRCDVSDEEQVAAAVADVVARLGRLDVALANAGFSVTGRVEDLTADDWRRQFGVNVVGAALTARYALPHLREHDGRVGFIGSIASFMCSPKLGAYNASKHALRAVAQTLSMELHGSGVSCTIVHPGYVESEIAQVDNRGRFDESRRDRRPQNLMWPSARAAEVIVRALHRRRREVVFTGHGKVGAFIGQHMPAVAHRMMARGRRG